MPYKGKIYTSNELQELLGQSKQVISNWANRNNWAKADKGHYYAQDVEPMLEEKGIDIDGLPVKTFKKPDG